VKAGGTVNNMTNITSCCERMADPGGLCAPACSLAARVRTEPRFDSGGTALEKVVAVNGLPIQVTASRFRAPKCLVAEDMSEPRSRALSLVGPVLQKAGAVNGLSNPVTASSLSEPK